MISLVKILSQLLGHFFYFVLYDLSCAETRLLFEWIGMTLHELSCTKIISHPNHFITYHVYLSSCQFISLTCFYTKLLVGIAAHHKRGNCKYLKIIFHHNNSILLVFMVFIMYCTIISTNIYFVALDIISFDEVLRLKLFYIFGPNRLNDLPITWMVTWSPR